MKVKAGGPCLVFARMRRPYSDLVLRVLQVPMESRNRKSPLSYGNSKYFIYELETLFVDGSIQPASGGVVRLVDWTCPFESR